ncbi:MAG: DUF1800 family protein [Candidatus Kapabacteria bacterium]|nr:DUF1800 family protein [Ignavibacteriota bacterium]MCW5884906.1 DUF1800 family protein [Candidatus Kapabacteria bacterium]
MDRRDFLRRSFTGRPISNFEKPPEIAGDLSQYEKPLDRYMAAHLLRRITLGPTPELLDSFEGKFAIDAVDTILGEDSDPLNNGESSLSWLDTQEENPLDGLPLDIRFDIEGKLHSRYRNFVDWWLDTMRNEKDYFQEKFTLFLSTVWCIEFEYDTLSLIPPPLLYRNNMLLRKYRAGNYKELATEMTLDGAMLLYQSLNYSTAKFPNENFMRELLELFTMGIGHYSEGDIREGSRVLTGWRTAAYRYKPAPNGIFNSYFSPADHDTESKQIMGVTIPARSEFDNSEFQVKEQEIKGLINILFSQRPQQIARFICDKIYRYFVYSSPGDVPDDVISQMSQTLISNNFNLRAVFRQLFSSKHFYDSQILGCQIKTPPEYIIGLQRALDTVYRSGNTLLSRDACNQLEMELYNPPNVGSWIGYRTWTSTTTYPLRIKFANDILNGTSDSNLFKIIKNFNNYDNIDGVIAGLYQLLMPVIPNDERISFHRDIANQSLGGSNWKSEIDSESAKSAEVIREIIKSIFLVPDFSLC